MPVKQIPCLLAVQKSWLLSQLISYTNIIHMCISFSIPFCMPLILLSSRMGMGTSRHPQPTTRSPHFQWSRRRYCDRHVSHRMRLQWWPCPGRCTGISPAGKSVRRNSRHPLHIGYAFLHYYELLIKPCFFATVGCFVCATRRD
jgi:hypothetical protein